MVSTQQELDVVNHNLGQFFLFTLKLDNIEDYLRKVSVTQYVLFVYVH